MPSPESTYVDNLAALFIVRLATVGILVAGVLLLTLRPEPVRSLLGRYFLARSGPLNLAIFRIVVFGHVFRAARRVHVDQLLDIPPVLRQVAPGWEWLDQGMDLFDPTLAHAAARVTMVAAACAIVGLGTRVAAPVAALCAIYLFGLPNFFTKVNHAGHAAMWSALVLSASACGDALSLDSLWKTWRRRAPRLSMPVVSKLAYALPLRVCWLLWGVGYFFAGLTKLWEAGDQWITGQALLARLTLVDAASSFPFHEYRALLVLGGVGTLLFELGFVFLVLSPRTRLGVAALGVMFHVGVKYVMGISFMATVKLYVSFIDFEWLLGRWAHLLPVTLQEHLALPGQPLDRSSRAPSTDDPLPRFVVAVGAVLAICNGYAGYGEINSWPFTVFPRFSQRAQQDAPKRCANRMVILRPSGTKRVVHADQLKQPISGPRWNYLVRDILATKDKGRRRELFEASAELMKASRIRVRSKDQLAIERACVVEDGSKRVESLTIRAAHRTR